MKQSKHLINTFMNTDPSSSDAPDFAAEACQEINTYVNHNCANSAIYKYTH